MINISFDNPLLLLLLIPMLALILVPYFIAIRKENKSRAGVIALALHIVIVILVVLAAAGMSNVTVITETELYVLADVSDSMSDRLDLVDEYIEKVVTGITDRKDELDALIADSAKGWKLERLSAASLAIMRLATYEMLYVDDVPFSVAINEAVELTKTYGGEESFAFVNAILGKLAKKWGE